MNASTVLRFPEQELRDASKTKLIQMILSLRTELHRLQTESDEKIAVLNEKLAEKEAELEKKAKSRYQ